MAQTAYICAYQNLVVQSETVKQISDDSEYKSPFYDYMPADSELQKWSVDASQPRSDETKSALEYFLRCASGLALDAGADTCGRHLLVLTHLTGESDKYEALERALAHYKYLTVVFIYNDPEEGMANHMISHVIVLDVDKVQKGMDDVGIVISNKAASSVMTMSITPERLSSAVKQLLGNSKNPFLKRSRFTLATSKLEVSDETEIIHHHAAFMHSTRTEAPWDVSTIQTRAEIFKKAGMVFGFSYIPAYLPTPVSSFRRGIIRSAPVLSINVINEYIKQAPNLRKRAGRGSIVNNMFSNSGFHLDHASHLLDAMDENDKNAHPALAWHLETLLGVKSVPRLDDSGSGGMWSDHSDDDETIMAAMASRSVPREDVQQGVWSSDDEPAVSIPSSKCGDLAVHNNWETMDEHFWMVAHRQMIKSDAKRRRRKKATTQRRTPTTKRTDRTGKKKSASDKTKTSGDSKKTTSTESEKATKPGKKQSAPSDSAGEKKKKSTSSDDGTKEKKKSTSSDNGTDERKKSTSSENGADGTKKPTTSDDATEKKKSLRQSEDAATKNKKDATSRNESEDKETASEKKKDGEVAKPKRASAGDADVPTKQKEKEKSPVDDEKNTTKPKNERISDGEEKTKRETGASDKKEPSKQTNEDGSDASSDGSDDSDSKRVQKERKRERREQEKEAERDRKARVKEAEFERKQKRKDERAEEDAITRRGDLERKEARKTGDEERRQQRKLTEDERKQLRKTAEEERRQARLDQLQEMQGQREQLLFDRDEQVQDIALERQRLQIEREYSDLEDIRELEVGDMTIDAAEAEFFDDVDQGESSPFSESAASSKSGVYKLDMNMFDEWYESEGW